MNVRVFFTCFACTILILAAGCEEQPVELMRPVNPVEEEVRNTVLLYNQLLEDGFRKMNMTPMQQVATRRQAEKLYHYMSAVGEGKGRLDSTLKKIHFVEIEVNEQKDGARVETKEIWDFELVDFESGKIYESRRDFVYNLTYTLSLEAERWVVTQVVDQDVVQQQDKKEKDGELEVPGEQEK